VRFPAVRSGVAPTGMEEPLAVAGLEEGVAAVSVGAASVAAPHPGRKEPLLVPTSRASSLEAKVRFPAVRSGVAPTGMEEPLAVAGLEEGVAAVSVRAASVQPSPFRQESHQPALVA